MSEPTPASQSPPADTQAGDELFAQLTDEFLRRHRAGERPALDEYATKHPELADRIRDLFPAMLAMEQPDAGPTFDSTPSERIGAVINRYKLLERIGEGGFGVVYMAEQQEPVRRKVALKVVKPGMDSRQVLARFEAERQALAIMDHPNIARVFDGGMTDSGRPFFVMELVKGEPITEFCDRNHFSPRQRLELFAQVCHAVQHAHQKGLIHRDIKPTNVLVATHDTTPVVKVIDFGVAKALGQELTERTLFTGFAQLVGTPLYMSPEQAGQSSLDVDTRSDIYSLGVLLYELLTGTTPFDKERFKQAAQDEIRRIIREEEPPRPSTRLSESKESLASISAQRHTEPAKLTKLVRGELDWIVMKALEKDRNRRYETANAFAADVLRYLNDEPVSACPPSAGYRLRKFAQRNKGPMTVGLALAALLLLGTVGTSIGLRRALRAERTATILATAEAQQRRDAETQRDKAITAEKQALAEKARADEEAAIATAVTDFLRNDLILQASPLLNARDKKVTVEELLARASASIDGRFEKQPQVEAGIRRTIGNAYQQLGYYSAAQPHLERSLELRRLVLGEEHADTLLSMNELANLYKAQGQFAKAEPLFLKAVEISRRVIGEDHSYMVPYMTNLASVYACQGRFAKAEFLIIKALDLSRRISGNENPNTLMCMHYLGSIYQGQGEFGKAEPIYLNVIEGQRRILGQGHPHTLKSMTGLALLYQYRGEFAKAESLYVKVLEGQRRVLEEDHPDTLISTLNLATLYEDQGRLAKSERMYREMLEKARRRSDEDWFTSVALVALGRNLNKQKKYADAEPLLREALNLDPRKQLSERRVFNAKSLLGASLLGQKKYSEAEPLLLAGCEGLCEREETIPVGLRIQVTEAIEQLVKLYEATSQPEHAATWRRKLDARKTVATTGKADANQSSQ